MSEDRQKQFAAFLQLLDLMMQRNADEREKAIRGFDIFFDRGWPTKCFTAGMALRAGAGLIPNVYTGSADEYHYRELMDSEDKLNQA